MYKYNTLTDNRKIEKILYKITKCNKYIQVKENRNIQYIDVIVLELNDIVYIVNELDKYEIPHTENYISGTIKLKKSDINNFIALLKIQGRI